MPTGLLLVLPVFADAVLACFCCKLSCLRFVCGVLTCLIVNCPQLAELSQVDSTVCSDVVSVAKRIAHIGECNLVCWKIDIYLINNTKNI